jgi:hypothetical protein
MYVRVLKVKTFHLKQNKATFASVPVTAPIDAKENATLAGLLRIKYANRETARPFGRTNATSFEGARISHVVAGKSQE